MAQHSGIIFTESPVNQRLNTLEEGREGLWLLIYRILLVDGIVLVMNVVLPISMIRYVRVEFRSVVQLFVITLASVAIAHHRFFLNDERKHKCRGCGPGI